MLQRPTLVVPAEPSTRGPSKQILSDKVYSLIIDLILRGEFHAQGKLPTETEFAKRFEVSRPTVREALSRLRADGIITSRRGSRSHIVRLPDVDAVRRRTTVESIADIERYYAFRMVMEAGAAGLAAEKHDEADLAAIRSAYARLTAALNSDAAGVDEDVAFHLAIAAASHNQFFTSTIEFIVGPLRQCMEFARNLFPTRTSDLREVLESEHYAIVEAIASRSSSEASDAVRRHIESARRRIFEGQ